jgi:threonine dehydrogenase-like Zn-dependent dehydrogenase
VKIGDVLSEAERKDDMGETMRAVAVVPGAREVRLVEKPLPTLASPTDVKLRILEVGVCGTDREVCAFEYGTPPQGSDHLVIGHESLGEVVEVGPKVSGVRVGDLVVPMVRRPCPHDYCRPCQAGRQDFCVTGDIRERGIKEAHGFMTEFVVDEERFMNVVPKDLRPVAVLVEPLTIAEKALLQLFELQHRLPWDCPHTGPHGRGHCHTAVVLGAGPVGLLGAMAFAALGFETFVYSAEPENHWKVGLVSSFGATFVSAQTHSIDQLRERVGNIDFAYEATGNSRVTFDLLRVLGTNGIFVMTGVPGHKGPAPVDTDGLMRNMVLKNQIILGTVNAGQDAFQGAIRDLGIFMERWPDAVRALITGRHPIEAHRDLLLGTPTGVKNVITFNGRTSGSAQ